MFEGGEVGGSDS